MPMAMSMARSRLTARPTDTRLACMWETEGTTEMMLCDFLLSVDTRTTHVCAVVTVGVVDLPS